VANGHEGGFHHVIFVLTAALTVAIHPLQGTGGHSMKKRPLILKIAVIANALLITIVFVGCLARKDEAIVPAPIASPPILVTIAPYGGNFQNILPPIEPPPPPSQDSKNDKRSP
jgi:hypothetical protein